VEAHRDSPKLLAHLYQSRPGGVHKQPRSLLVYVLRPTLHVLNTHSHGATRAADTQVAAHSGVALSASTFLSHVPVLRDCYHRRLTADPVRVSPDAVLRRAALVGEIVAVGVAEVPAYVLLQGRQSHAAIGLPPLRDSTGAQVCLFPRSHSQAENAWLSLTRGLTCA
jgi:hypothetical protein